ncbi:DUF3530 family protein [Shewanella sp. GXUN23E]|uniref:DUF3530 family protein n=1 Tax=Shewanella sp. GXUN23E TaxID=3422498 RepID=UPI003D7E0656
MSILTRSALTLMLLALMPPALSAETFSYQPQIAQAGYDYLPDDELRSIQVGAQSSPVLVRSWEGRHQYGAVILLASPGQVPDTPGLIAHLRRALNSAGWASINLSSPLPLPRANFSTTAESVANPGEGQLKLTSGQSTPDYSMTQMSEFISQRQASVSEALGQLDVLGSEFPGKRLMIVSNQTAAMVIELLNQEKIPTPDLLVVFNPYLPQPQLNAALISGLEKLSIPVLDIQSPDGHPASRETLTKRQHLSRSKGPAKYRQLQLALDLDIPSAWQDATVAIKGFAYTSLIR